MSLRLTRRALMAIAMSEALITRSRSTRAAGETEWSFPIAFDGGTPGDGLYIKHGYACQNAEFYPGLLHTGENWYGDERNALEADVLAAADGTVVYADFDYPGPVVIIQHEPELFSMYGHLDYDLAVETGQEIKLGDRIGSPIPYPGDIERSHLHFEIRSFYTTDIVNGDHPSHGFTCGYQCPPGPGYWPIDAPQHPSDLGWMNPTHVISRRMFPDGPRSVGASVVVNKHPSSESASAWSSPPWKTDSRRLDDLPLNPGEQFTLLQVAPGANDSHGRDATAYRLWYRIALPSGDPIWVQSAAPSFESVGLDGKPSSVRFDLFPLIPNS
jgi:murein DD-endopeptidase MepM/ murein hydrolase activator NlpD